MLTLQSYRRTFPYLSFGIALLVSLYPNLAQSEVFNCEGVLTNVPCDQLGSISSTVKDPAGSPKDPALSQKQSLFHDLNMANIRARREFEIRSDLAPVEKFCFDPAISLEDCKKRIERAYDLLDKKVIEVKNILAQEEALELQRRANELQEERNELEAAKVVVQRRPRVYIVDHSEGTTVVPLGPASDSVIILDTPRDKPPHHKPPRPRPKGNHGEATIEPAITPPRSAAAVKP